MAIQPGLVSFPAATNPAARRMSASMNAHAARASAPQVRTRSSNPSNAAIRGAYPPDCPETGYRPGRDPNPGEPQQTEQGPGALMQLRGPVQGLTSGVRDQFF